ncbi:MAG: hypothetical protein WB562_07280 [Candidatus Sulfotelmatobacter sp.]
MPNCFAYSAFSRCQPLNFMISASTMRPIGSPAFVAWGAAGWHISFDVLERFLSRGIDQ